MKVARFQNDIHYKETKEPNFKGNPLIGLATYLDERVMLGKAVLDITAFEAPQIIMANNNDERRERFNKSLFGFSLGYLSPLITLPLTNRLAMKYIAKLTPKLSATESNLIHISNKYLKNKEVLKEGIKLLEKEKNTPKLQDENLLKRIVKHLFKEEKTDYSQIIEKCGGDYEVLRKKLINAKNAVLAFDLLFTSASIGCVGFFNNWQTKRKTKQDGYSAEFSMADKDVVEKRAENFKKKEPLRKTAWLGILAALTLSPLLLRKGLISQKPTAFNNYIKKFAPKFDYADGIFMSRLILLLGTLGVQSGIILASRNKTELKDTSTRSAVSTIAFFGGDILIGSILGRLSDKYLKTNLINRDAEKSFLNKLIPPTRKLKDLAPRDRKIGAALYWINLAMLSACMGFGMPHLINKMIRHDVQKDVQSQNKTSYNMFPAKQIRMEDFIKQIK